MIYFKTIVIQGGKSEEVEHAIRKYSAKRHAIIDFQQTTSNIRGEKIFIGVEDENGLRITRLRTSFERLLPKFIIRFRHCDGFAQYQIRFSFLSTLIILFLLFSVLVSTYDSVLDGMLSNDLFGPALLLVGYIILAIGELHLTKSKINIAIKKDLE